MASYNASTRKALMGTNVGIRVDRATKAVATGDVFFTIAGGRVLLTLILGQVTTAFGAGANACKLSADPTVGTTTDLCATGEMNAAELGTLISIAGTAGTAMQLGKSGAVRAQDAAFVVAPGTIIWTQAAADAAARVKWSLWYVPLDDGATVTAA